MGVRYRLLGLGSGVLLALACGGLDGSGGGAAGGGEWACDAQGVWAECTTSGGYEACYERDAKGMGIEASRVQAEGAATWMCTEHMTKMVIIANMNGRGEIRRSCAVTRCYPAR